MRFFATLLIFNLLTFSNTFAQSKSAEEYRSKLETFRAMHPPAMLYFHFDKSFYSAGDSLRFKVYQVENEDWKPRATPQFIDFQFIALEDNKIILTEKTVLDNGVAIGAIALPKDLKTGVFRFKADSYLMNFDAQHLDFQQDIKILGNETFVKKTVPFQASCFAEGGNLVQGILSKITVSANEDGTGKLVNEKGDSLAFFNVVNGFTSFKYRPKSTDKLFVKIKNQTLPLPEVKPYGITMSIDNIGSDADLTIIVAAKFPEAQQEQRVTIMTENNGKTGQYFDLIAVNGKTIQVFPKAALKHGIMRFSMLDANTNILAERLLYHHSPNLFYLNCQKNVKDLGKELEITLNIDASDLAGKPVDANLSISISDSLNYAENVDFQDIVTAFTLQQNFEKPISNIEKYFKNNRLTDAKEMDNLMLSQKYARYDWQEVKAYQYKALDTYRVPYADERKAAKPRHFEPKNGLLYWNPEIILVNGKAIISFKVPKNTHLHYDIQGFDSNGALGNLKF